MAAFKSFGHKARLKSQPNTNLLITCVAGRILLRPMRGNGSGAANSRGKAARSEGRSREIPPAGKLGFFECRPLLAPR